MKKTLLLPILLATSFTAAAQSGFYTPIPYYGNNPYVFCTVGVPWDCWAPISPVTGAYTVTDWECFNPTSALLFQEVCPKAFPMGTGGGSLGSASQPQAAPTDPANTN